MLQEWFCRSAKQSQVTWFSVNSIWHDRLWRLARDFYAWEKIPTRLFIWHFTFGQHRQKDCGNCYRPIFRIGQYDWNTDAIRVPSDRQTKYNDKRADPRGRVPGDVWTFPRVCGTFKERRRWHPTQHPEALVERCILMSTKEGDLVIDPFLGSGTTLRVCQRLNRRCIGIELSETYCQKVSEETGVPVVQADGLPLMALCSDAEDGLGER